MNGVSKQYCIKGFEYIFFEILYDLTNDIKIHDLLRFFSKIKSNVKKHVLFYFFFNKYSGSLLKSISFSTVSQAFGRFITPTNLNYSSTYCYKI